MRAGSLRERITLERLEPGEADAWGEQDTGMFTPVATLWASVTPIDSNERLTDGAVMTEASHRVRIRWNASPPTTRHRITWNSRTLDILGVIDHGRRRGEIEIICKEHPA